MEPAQVCHSEIHRTVSFDISELKELKEVPKFTPSQLAEITRNYRKLLWEGRFTKVYLGIFGQQLVAVKVPGRHLDIRQRQAFVTEIRIQSAISHKNVVKLLGYCSDGVVPILVYEYVSRGKLFNILHGKEKEKETLPALATRLDIALQTAKGLAYLHSAVRLSDMMHGDIRSENILLDKNFEPKIMDFGLTKVFSSDFTECTLHALGSFPYNVDLELLKDGELTQKIDAYDFGVVLLELITGRQAVSKGKLVAKQFVSEYTTENKGMRMFEEHLTTSREDMGVLVEVAALAMDCINSDVTKRPSMDEVVIRLEGVASPLLGISKKQRDDDETPQREDGDTSLEDNNAVGEEEPEEDEHAPALGKGEQKILGKVIKYGFCLIKGKVKHPMEDRHVVDYKQDLGLGYFAIFDGHGGHLVAEFLKDQLLDNILAEQGFLKESEKAIKSAYEKVDEKILENEEELGTAGSTALTAFLIGDKNINVIRLVVANVGDSRAVMCKNGIAEPLSVDHEPKSERQMIEDKGGFVSHIPGDVARVDGQLTVSRAFGDST